MTLREQMGGNRIISGGVQTVFGEGLYGMFSPPLSLPPPLVFSEFWRRQDLNNHKRGVVKGGYGFGCVSDMYPSSFDTYQIPF